MLQQERTMVAEVRRRYESLTKREREVMRLVLSGLLNKQIAGELGKARKAGRVASPSRPRFAMSGPWSSGPLGDRTLPSAGVMRE
jgi:FixJ family two-component response regulator